MMASDRSKASPPPAEPETPEAAIPTETPPPPVSPPTRPTHGTVQPSPFLHGFDMVLALGVIVLGFAIASFTAKNSDLWLHLGMGRAIAEGKSDFGTAPFAYGAAADRYWTNHSWLFDVALFKGYTLGSGRALIFGKAALVALLAFVLLLTRRPGQSWWIGVVCTGLALLASAPRLLLQSSLLSYLFLALTILALTRPCSRRLPIWIGCLFFLWSNCDQWFILGPIVVVLFLVGTLLQRRGSSATSGEQQVSPRILALTLAVGVAACMLNPHHFHVWQLPPELFPGQYAALDKDGQFSGYFRTSFERGVFDLDGKGNGNPVNSYGLFVLVLLNVLGILLNVKRLSLGLLLVNITMLGLALFHHRAVPFYAVVAAAFTALNLGAFLTRCKEATYPVGTLQVFAGLRMGARMTLFAAGLLALTASWAGWLHPFFAQRRLGWDVEADPALEQTARKLQQWRDDGSIPAEARSLILSIDLAHYCAWYAPSEKTFFDLRLDLRSPDVQAYAKLRQYFFPVKDDASKSDNDPTPFLRERRVTHVVLAGNTRTGENAISFQRLISNGWALWNVNGRVSVFGWPQQDVLPPQKFAAMKLRLQREAFRQDLEPTADPGTLVPPVKRDFAEKFLTPLPTAPASADESDLYVTYIQSRMQTLRNIEQLRRLQVITRYHMPPPQVPSDILPAGWLATRAARRAIIESPGHPAGYYSLANVANDPSLVPISNEIWSKDRRFLSQVSYERFFAHATPDYLASHPALVYQAALRLADHHLPGILQDFTSAQIRALSAVASGENRGDQGLEALKLQEMLRKLPQTEVRAILTASTSEIRADLALESLKRAVSILKGSPLLREEQYREELKILEARVLLWEKEIKTLESLWLNATVNAPSQFDRAMAALNFWIPKKALEELNKVDTSASSKVPGPQQLNAMTAQVRLLLVTGQAESAEARLNELEERMGGFEREKPDMLRNQDYVNFKGSVRELHLQTSLVVGRFSEAITLISQSGTELHNQIDIFRRQIMPRYVAYFVARHLGAPTPSFLEALIECYRLRDRRTGRTYMELYHEEVSRKAKRSTDAPLSDEAAIGQYINLLIAEENLHYRLGLLYLEQGNNAKARFHFRQAEQALPSRITTPTREAAAFFLRMIEAN